MYIYVYIYTYIYTCYIYICICIHRSTPLYTYTYLYTHICIYLRRSTDSKMQSHTYADGEDSTDSLCIFAIQHTVICTTLVVKYFQAKRPMFMQRVSKQDTRLENNTREAYLHGIIYILFRERANP